MIKFVPVYCFLLLLMVSCGGNHKFGKIVDDAEECVMENPDSALTILKGIEEPQNLLDSVKAKYWLVMGQAHYNKDVSMYRDSLLSYSLHYYNKVKPNDTKHRSQAYLLYSRYLYLMNKDKEAVELLESGLAITGNDDIAKISILQALVEFTGEEGTCDFSKQLEYLNKLIEIDKDKYKKLDYLTQLAVCYSIMGDKENALQIYGNISDYIKTPQDSTYAWGIVWSNYADLLAYTGEYQKAVEMQDKVLDYYKKTESPYAIFSYISLAWYYLNMNRQDIATQYLDMAEKERIDKFDGFVDIEMILSIERLLADYRNTGKFSYYKAMVFVNNINSRQLHNQWIKYAQEYDVMAFEKDNLELMVSKQHQRIVLLMLVILIILLSTGAYLYIRKRQILIEEKEGEIDALKTMVSESKRSSDDKDDRFFKKIMLQQLGIIRMLSENPSSANQEMLHRMAEIADKKVQVESLLNWDDLYKSIDLIYDGFYSNIIGKYGEVLNDKEIQLCCLLKANFSTKEMSVVMQQSVRTIYQRKTVIRQKLQLEEKTDIAEFLSAVKN